MSISGPQITDLTKSMNCLFYPNSVAVIGASSTPGKWGYIVFSRLISSSFKGEIYPINRNVAEVLGHRAYKDLSAVPEDIDLAVIVVPPQAVPASVQECVDKSVKAAVVITAGFKETGREGAELESQVSRIAKSGGLRFVGPNCDGHFNTVIGLFTNTIETTVKTGEIALISQSGNFGGYVLQRGVEAGVGFSKYVSSGNEADLTIEDYLEYFGQDKETKVICAYIEGIKNGRRFFELAKQISTRKPIVVMKVGRSTEGARAASSHTGALSGADTIHDAMFYQSGIIRVDKVDELLNVAMAFLRQPLPKGKRVGIITAGGGFGVVAADACRSYGLEVPPLTEETVQALDKYAPPRWSHANPVDIAGTNEGTYGCLGNLLKADYIDTVLAIGIIGFPRSRYDISANQPSVALEEYLKNIIETETTLIDGLIQRMAKYQKPLIITAPIGREKSPAISKLEQFGIYSYRTPEDGAKVISCLVRYSDYVKTRGHRSEG